MSNDFEYKWIPYDEMRKAYGADVLHEALKRIRPIAMQVAVDANLPLAVVINSVAHWPTCVQDMKYMHDGKLREHLTGLATRVWATFLDNKIKKRTRQIYDELTDMARARLVRPGWDGVYREPWCMNKKHGFAVVEWRDGGCYEWRGELRIDPDVITVSICRPPCPDLSHVWIDPLWDDKMVHDTCLEILSCVGFQCDCPK